MYMYGYNYRSGQNKLFHEKDPEINIGIFFSLD